MVNILLAYGNIDERLCESVSIIIIRSFVDYVHSSEHQEIREFFSKTK